MTNKNIVFVAKSLDGYIAGKNGELDWLNAIPNPENIDMGYNELINNIDAIVMGSNTFKTVLKLVVEWPYTKPVFVLSNSITEVPIKLINKVFILNGSVNKILNTIHNKGYHTLYIDGGATVQSFLKDDQIDEMILTTFPILLGGGSSLFGENDNSLFFEHISTKKYLNQIVQDRYIRKRNS